MQGLILAAGRGSRLGDITKHHPKGLTLLADKPLIEWQISAMNKAGIKQINACTGYLFEQISPYVSGTFYNEHWHSSNMVRSLMMAFSALSAETTMISYSDIIYSENCVKRLAETKGDIVIAYDPNWLTQWQLRFDNPLEDAESFMLNDHGKLTEIGRSNPVLEDVMGQYMGLIKLTPAGCEKIKSYLSSQSDEQVNQLDMTTLLNNLINNGVCIDVCAIDESWFEIDNEKDLAICEKTLQDFNWITNES